MTDDEIRLDAWDERMRLYKQARQQHRDRLAAEMRRYEEECEQIEQVFHLRLTAIGGGPPEDGGDNRYEGQPALPGTTGVSRYPKRPDPLIERSP
jgi:hypothetical protein